MSSRTPLVLGVLCLLLAAFYWFVERKAETTADQERTAKRVFGEFERDKIESIDIRNEHGDILIEGKRDLWKLKAPVKDGADNSEVASFLSALEYLDRTQRFTVKNVEKDLGAYGLEKPRAVLRVKWGNDQAELRIGRQVPVGEFVYAQTQKNSPDVYVIGKRIADDLLRDANAWRDKRLVAFPESGVKRMRITRGGRDIEVRKREDGWVLTQPIGARGAETEIQNLIRAVVDGRIARFVSEDASDLDAYGLREPILAVEFDVKGEDDNHELVFGSPTKEDAATVYAKRGGGKAPVFAVSTNVTQKLQAEVETLRDRKLVRLVAEEVDRVVLRDGTNRIEAVRKDGNWREPGGEGRVLNGEPVDAFVRRVRDMQVSRFVADAVADLKKHGLDAPAVRAEFWTTEEAGKAAAKDAEKDAVGAKDSKKKDGKEKEGKKDKDKDRDKDGEKEERKPERVVKLAAAIEIGKAEKGERFARLEDEPFVVAISTNDFVAFQVAPWAWRSLDVGAGEPEKASQVRITRGGAVEVYERDGALWKSPKGAADFSAVATLLGRLATLQAVRWVGPQPGRALKAADLVVEATGEKFPPALSIWKGSPPLGRLGGEGALYFELSAADMAVFEAPIPAAATNAAPQGADAGTNAAAVTEPVAVPAK